MLSRVLTETIRHGRRVLEGFVPKTRPCDRKAPEIVRVQGPRPQTWAPRIYTQRTPAKGYLVEQFARYARQNMAKALREQFNKSNIYREYSGLARKLSMFAFVGVGFAGFSGRNEEQGFESVCDHIKSLFEAKAVNGSQEDYSDKDLSCYRLGPMIGKGSYGVVYQAKSLQESEVAMELESDEGVSMETEEDSDVEVLSELESECASLQAFCQPEDEESFVLVDTDESDVEVIDEDEVPEQGVYFCMQCQQQGVEQTSVQETEPAENLSDRDFDLAIKMMFNYGVESNATALTRAMYKELLPMQVNNDQLQEMLGCWENGHRAKEKNRLPPHPNIVDMEGAFVDAVPLLKEGLEQYPDALPSRLNPEGSGRNKTLFVVMKKYTCTLREYLAYHSPLPVDHSILLFTQLVEAVCHLSEHGIAHRDIKSDNVLLEVCHPEECPRLVLSDFGDCLCEGVPEPLLLPYSSSEVNRGGNGALMAPEIVTAIAGPHAWLDYRKSDLWAAGVLSYEIFGLPNPFYRQSNGASRLNSATYQDGDLPQLPDEVPFELREIIRHILKPNPRQRPTSQEVAVKLHLYLWTPSDLRVTLTPSRSSIMASRRQLMRWLLTLTARCLCEKGLDIQGIDCLLRRSFLSRLDFRQICLAFE